MARGLMSPEEAAISPRRHMITRAVGVHAAVEIDARIIDLRAGDVFLLCSDGLHGEVSDEDIRSILVVHPDPEAAVGAPSRGRTAAVGPTTSLRWSRASTTRRELATFRSVAAGKVLGR